MQIHQRRATAESLDDRALPYGDLLRGYRFRVCTDPASFAAALDVRRRVYQGGCGYDVPVPDEYDGRSWLLLAEHVEAGETVGTMRIAPRSAGPLEAGCTRGAAATTCRCPTSTTGVPGSTSPSTWRRARPSARCGSRRARPVRSRPRSTSTSPGSSVTPGPSR